MTEKELIRRALLGDKEAQRECTEKGIVLPCPFCKGNAVVSYDPDGTRDSEGRKWAYTIVCEECVSTSGLGFSTKMILKSWNTRPAPPIGRCGECEHYNTKLHYCDILSQESDYREVHYVLMSPDDFCSHFEPKGESR